DPTMHLPHTNMQTVGDLASVCSALVVSRFKDGWRVRERERIACRPHRPGLRSMVASVPRNEIGDNPLVNLLPTAAYCEPQTKVWNERAEHEEERTEATNHHGTDP